MMHSLNQPVLITRWISVKIVLNLVKASKLVQMKLKHEDQNYRWEHLKNFLLLFVHQYGCLKQMHFTEEENF